MVVAYPDPWIARVARAEKLTLDPDTGHYRSPDGRQEVTREAVTSRTDAYLKAESLRRRKRLNREEEKLCRDFVLLVANWRTGAWERRTESPRTARRTTRTRANPSN